VIGKQHEDAGGRCEDAWHAVRRVVPGVDQEVVATCVCDGAGSTSKGWLGAVLVSKLVSNWLVANFARVLEMSKDDAGRKVVATAKRCLRRLATKECVNLREFACTMAAVAVAQDGRWVALHLGDGGIVGQFDTDLKPICVPKKGKFVNETFFVTDEDAASNVDIQTSLRTGYPTLPSGFALFSDGVEISLLDRRSMQVAPVVATMLGWLVENSEKEVTEAIEANLKAVFREKTSDDCTLALLVCHRNGKTSPDQGLG
jgi:serine/threonine protein phosphatase PrpC